MQVKQVRVLEASIFSKLTIACLASVTAIAALTVYLVTASHHQAAAWLVFSTVLAFVFLEHYTGVSKSAIAMTGMVLLFLIARSSGVNFASVETQHHLWEIFYGHYGIILFLMAAMFMIALANKYGTFDLMQATILSVGVSDKKQAVVILLATAISSGIIDNLTAALIFTTLSAMFFQGLRLLLVVSGVVIMANTGGAASIIGDFTTIMLWMGGKITAIDALKHIGLSCLAMGIATVYMVVSGIENGLNNCPDQPTELKKMDWSEKLVIGFIFIGFFFPLFANLLFGIPSLGIVFAAGLAWVLVNALRKFLPKHKTHLEAEIEEVMKEVDTSSVWFFAAILGCVGALEIMHCLEGLMHGLDSTLVALGVTGVYSKAVAICVSLGALSALVDNIPLVAIAMKVLQSKDPAIWSLLALTAGTGGSMLITGSAAGIVAMRKCPGLTFTTYLKIAGRMSVGTYILGVLVWGIQHYYLFI